MKLTNRNIEIFWLVFKHKTLNISEISELLSQTISIPTLNRDLAALKENSFLTIVGKGPSTKYQVPLTALVNIDIPVENYYKKTADERPIFEKFNFTIFESLKNFTLFTQEELESLNTLTEKYNANTKTLSKALFQKEFERLTIELSWKSAQIEGNTYDLLDTEQLLKYNVLSKKNSKEEAIMLLNHKSAIEYSKTYAKDFKTLTVRKISELHSLLTQKMGIAKNIRKRVVRITGTNYTPPENEFLIQEYLENAVVLINSKKNVYEKALLTILFISYIQAFEDGNKRTARITGNALLMANKCCPLSYRNIAPTDYKKAMLLFYEVNNVSAFKKIFIEQYKFAVENYF